ncbi:hypothetical protein BBO99_00004199 [Phytophthora kernoviae]|uniref:Peptidase S1 domain-containing protein n=1 Tax=Phytophthora kernoviae TaxID=325452 RepID=A0A3R7IEN3_9STRA|nr:hypothetical protein JM18_003492 [Phytophthora kernoviae]KAG2526169.1 hypothetical protein JM16_004035 [Phytophthora kernoviae]RLM97660.1 hypothetical protein BBI17_004045 [Phytophthora kernoviae]RLN80846.1 hypothetical protein BBO99_00004199 [Phytophthora kernoviae]
MNIIGLQRVAIVAAILAANVDGLGHQSKLNYQEYHSQLLANKPMAMNRDQEPITADIEPLILGGGIVPPGTKTYTTGVRPTANGTDFCGGSLITPTHVLTAAHCNAGDIQFVSVGTHFLSGTEDGEQIKVVNKTRHPKYASETNAYDFLVLELETASSFPPVALAKADGSNVVDGGNATVMGWGATTQGGYQSNELLRVDVPIVNNSACAKVLDVDSTMLCAGGVLDKDSCQGDSGGPLILEQSDEDVLIGVVSWGNGCGLAGYPGVYARVSVAVEWLNAVAPAVAATFGDQEEDVVPVDNEADDDVEEGQSLSRGQRKRLKRRAAFMRKMGMVSRVAQEQMDEQKTKENGMFADLEALQNSLFEADTANSDNKGTKHGKKKALSGKQRQKLAVRELGQLKAVQTHQSFKSDPFAAIQAHLQNTVVQANQELLQKTNAAAAKRAGGANKMDVEA